MQNVDCTVVEMKVSSSVDSPIRPGISANIDCTWERTDRKSVSLKKKVDTTTYADFATYNHNSTHVTGKACLHEKCRIVQTEATKFVVALDDAKEEDAGHYCCVVDLIDHKKVFITDDNELDVICKYMLSQQPNIFDTCAVFQKLVNRVNGRQNSYKKLSAGPVCISYVGGMEYLNRGKNQ